MKWIKKNMTTILLLLILLVGLSLLLYPTVSDYWNSLHQSRAIATYAQAVAEVDDKQYEHMWEDAYEYNQQLKSKSNRWIMTDEEREEYESLLNVIYNGIIGSSLPVGGPGTHAVLSGHRGLPSAKLFTNLDELVVGDEFLIRVLDETLTYEVDQIRIVEPDDLSDLEIEEDKDLCTLVTCTPYGINTHRLLVRGHRVETKASASAIRVTADAIQIEPKLVAPAVAVPILVVLLIWVLLHSRKRK